MSQISALVEANRRIQKLPIPPAPARLDGLTVTLMNFETDGVAGGMVGGNSATFQKMVNRAAIKMLKERGARVKLTTVKLDAVVRWETDTKPLTMFDKLLFACEVFNAVIVDHRALPANNDEFHRQLVQTIREAKVRLE